MNFQNRKTTISISRRAKWLPHVIKHLIYTQKMLKIFHLELCMHNMIHIKEKNSFSISTWGHGQTAGTLNIKFYLKIFIEVACHL